MAVNANGVQIATLNAVVGMAALDEPVTDLDYSSSTVVCAACGSEDLDDREDDEYGYIVYCGACGAYGYPEDVMKEVVHV